jgi:predicted DNA-binding transcriptional regulator AlpA
MSNVSPSFDDMRLVGDGEIAKLLSMSKSWVRKQRFNRRHGLSHELTLDPVMVGGKTPRYRRDEVCQWVQEQSAKRGPNGRAV